MTDLDAFQTIWAEQDARLDRVLRLNTTLLQAAALDRARLAFRGLERRQWGAVCIWATILIGLGSFAADHQGEPVLCVSAFLAGLYTVWMLNAAVRQAIVLRELDFAEPVATLLRRAEALRLRRINQTRVGVLAGLVVWAPFCVVLCKCAFGVDLPSLVWLAGNILFGLALIPVWVLVARRFGARVAEWAAVKHLMDDIAGRTLNDTMRFLGELDAFTAGKIL